MKKTLVKFTARVLILSLGYQLVLPVYAYALTTGPSQPEVQSFEPIGTTEMVDMFTGDFTYNIPLMDVEGYPVNISYHSGIGVEQEASWVGLGWNINPGEINRAMRGLPDDFNGETIDKELKIADEENFRVGTGGSISLEIAGFDAKKYGLNLSLGFGSYINYNNYKGMSIGGNTSATISTPVASAGINLGLGSQTGADIDVNASLTISQKVTQDVGGGMSFSGGTGFNSRSGLKDLSFGVSLNTTANIKTTETKTNADKTTTTTTHSKNVGVNNASFGSTVPIGLQNYVPVVTNPSVLKSFEFQGRFGGEIFYTYPNVYLSIQKSTLKYETDGSKKGYGYLYAENAPEDGIMDFSRDKDGYYNNTLKNLPLASMTYDVYSISGQGTGGVFRPFRNDIGSIFDPKVKSPQSNNTSVLIEGGIGNLFEVGTDVTFFENESVSGPWKRLNFRGNQAGSFFEKVFFKQAGELTFNNQQVAGIYSNDPLYLSENETSLLGKGKAVKASLPAKYGNANIYWNSGVIDRTSRANLLSYLTAEEASLDDIGQYESIPHYDKAGTFPNPTAATPLTRSNSSSDKAQAHHISEFTQTLTDGRRYVYGIPAMNNMTREVTFSVNGGGADLNTGLVNYTNGSENTNGNSVGKEKFYSSTSTPAYAHSYLLSSVLSTDYVDVLGDGPTDDDMGSWVKYNYTLWDNDYRWKAPYESNKAQYNPGFWSDPDDDKGNYVIGSRQQWHIRSIESKNYIAEFYVTKRNDGKGVTEAVLTGNTKHTGCDYLKSGKSTGESYSYKLDSIKLFNKHDRYMNSGNAVPIKTVIFKYNYSLCRGIPNTADSASGKLTLERIHIRYGNSDKNLLSPYVFTYANKDLGHVDNNYHFENKDRWGNYKKNDPALSNYEFPYTKQEGANLDADAAPWELTSIKLPSGGKINIKYESDDYSFVQDRRTMEMFRVCGVGNSDKWDNKTALYEELDDVNDYIYFKRDTARENPNLSLKDNYLEGAELLYYSFNLDIAGSGKYEHIKGYAKIDAVGPCGDSANYGYVRIKKERPGDNNGHLLHPATIYGLNTGRYYIPHIIYPGFKGGGGAMQILDGLLAAVDEMKSIAQNPIVRFVEKRKLAKNIRLEKSWIRLNTPGLTKKGGGLRVKELTLNDSWQALSSGSGTTNADFGKTYDYTTADSKYGTGISSGIASYEPLVGGDENPFKMPVKYTADAGRLMPAIEFFQEEPFGESFFPPPVVGYSFVTVKSIHIDEGRSSQSVEEHEFFTAKDFPIEVDYTEKDAPNPVTTKGLRKKTEEIKVFQGYVLRFNDMHGKPRAVSNYIIKTDGNYAQKELVSAVKYNYRTDNANKLDNNVTAVVRNRGANNTYAVSNIKLGEEVDFTIDTRERYNRSYRRSVDVNVNVVLIGIFPIPIPTAFFPDKEETQTFRSMVSTKVIQKYGILKSVETIDHGARTVVENMIYDSETGDVLLTRTNNEYNDNLYDMKYPAYWAYEGMGPAYTNIGYEEKADSLLIEDRNNSTVSCSNNPTFYGRLFLNKDKFFPGDELLVTYKINDNTHKVKVWVLDEYPTINFCPARPYAYSVPYIGSPVNLHRRVALRNLRNNSGGSAWPGMVEGSVSKDVNVKVVRSGRRNNLSQVVQQARFTQNPYSSGINDILPGTSNAAFDNLLSLSVQEFSDFSRPYSYEYGDDVMMGNVSYKDYDPEIFPVNISSASKKDFNRYVLGHRGNYRPVSEYTYIASRNYAANNVRNEGKFSAKATPFWSNANGASGTRRILTTVGGLAPYWKKVREVTKYDVFGNAVEEKDATGKYISAQYGYNKSLPLAVASNVRQRSFSYEGFEDYNMLMPEHLLGLYKGTYFFPSAFILNYFNGTPNAGPSNYYGQNYKYLNLVNSGDSITKTASHTGFYSMRFANAKTVTIKTKDVDLEVQDQGNQQKSLKQFSMDTTRKYVISMWVKPVSGSASTVASSIGISYYNNWLGYPVTYPFQVKSGNIEGWYQVEYVFDIRFNQPQDINLTLPTNAYFDDIRFVPVDANMKSFVYDPITFKLIAQLDENNFATFYEYDQEGLLVRVKKETDRGIMTVSESRRSNTKKQGL